MGEAERRLRAERRRKIATIHRARLCDDEPDLAPLSGEAAVSLVLPLTRESWAEAGLPMPTYARPEIPIRFVPNG